MNLNPYDKLMTVVTFGTITCIWARVLREGNEGRDENAGRV